MKYFFKVDEGKELVSFLREKINDKSKNNIKSFLHKEMVLVNNKIITDPLYKLNVNDTISIKNFIYNNSLHLKIPIIYEDKNIIVVDKPSSLLTISTEKEKSRTLYKIVRDYIKANNKNSKIFIIHRLDKGTSGIIIFAKNQKTKNLYQSNWNKIVINKEYLAITSSLINDSGIIKSYLKENKEGVVYSSNEEGGKFAITKYKVISKNKKYSLLKINIKTGRKNQIRVHLKDIGFPIIGDSKYGSNTNPIKRLCLHAYKLEIIDPVTNKKHKFISEIPNSFYKLINF